MCHALHDESGLHYFEESVSVNRSLCIPPSWLPLFVGRCPRWLLKGGFPSCYRFWCFGL